ncbi:MAG: molybdate ABC transporter substrate-binding protein [Myxococcota bacterium]
MPIKRRHILWAMWWTVLWTLLSSPWSLSAQPASSPGSAGAAPPPPPITIAAASDLKFALDDVVSAFRKRFPAIDVKVSYGASGTFFAQLNNGAPFDMFFSADIRYPQELAQKGLVVEGSQFIYAEGHLVVWVPNSSPLDLQKLGILSLLEPSVQKIAIANPKHAPYGRAAEAALQKLGVYAQVQPKLVMGENIAQTAQFVQQGAADVGLVALSLALAGPMKNAGRYWELPKDSHPKLEQAAVILKRSTALTSAQTFQQFVTGTDGREILKRYGFVVPTP